jgi:osmoprotectant transport system permease protein
MPARTAPITIGAKTFTEQYILSEILAGQIRQGTGREVQVVQSLGSTVAFDALRSGAIDLYVEYSGTVWATLMGQSGTTADRTEVLAGVTRFLREEHGIAVASALGFENAYALAMRRTRAEQLGVRRISDLAPLASTLASAVTTSSSSAPSGRQSGTPTASLSGPGAAWTRRSCTRPPARGTWM